MKNKMGFTILEILAVIVIIATITAIAVPSIFKITNKAKDRLYCSKLEIVQKSAERYADDNSLDNTCEIDGTEYNCENITIQDLINGNYIDADGVDGAFLDPRDKLAINTTGVVVYEKNSRNYAYIEDDDCPSLITNILTPTELTNAKHSLTVTLDGGSWNGTSPVSLKEGSTLFVNDPIKYGSDFVGWTVTGNDSDINDQIFTMGLEDSTLTAVWQINSYALTVNANGGTWNGTSPQTINYGSSVTINDPIKSGYTFTGWTVNGVGSTISGTTFTMGTANTTLTANWTISEVNFVYTGGSQTYTALENGYYKIEAWGAQGGSNVGMEGSMAGNVGGYGGYTSGAIYLDKDDILYIYVGGQGQYAPSAGFASSRGYNGGGIAGYEPGCLTNCMKGAAGGGGATDIRYGGSSLYSRIMVAGGGGGAMNWLSPKAGGASGGLIGKPGMEYNAGSNSYTNAQGGTQVAGGAGASGATTGGSGSFGVGGDAYSVYGGGGGSGYYGGGGGVYNSSVVGSGAGGSSFISGYAGANAIISSSSTTATNNTIHYSGKYFINNSMLVGANSGNGKVKITFLSITAPEKANTNLNNIRYIKDCINGSSYSTTNYWNEIQAIVNGVNVAYGKTSSIYDSSSSSYVAMTGTGITNGLITDSTRGSTVYVGLQCAIVDLGSNYNVDEVAVWHYWVDGRIFYSNVTYVSSNGSTWTTVINTGNQASTSQGKRVSAY